MTLAWSRHAYAEVVTDQKVATWLGCHRRAFEWFNGVPRRLTMRACVALARSASPCALLTVPVVVVAVARGLGRRLEVAREAKDRAPRPRESH